MIHDELFDSSIIVSGETFDVTFNDAGIFDYFCNILSMISFLNSIFTKRFQITGITFGFTIMMFRISNSKGYACKFF